MRYFAIEFAKENEVIFTGNIDSNPYTAEFKHTEDGETFYGWFVVSTEDEYEIDMVFGSGQMIFKDGEYVTTEEDYYEIIGAGI